MNEFGGVRVVEQIDRDGDAFPQPDQRAWDLTVVAGGADRVILRDVRQHWRDTQRNVRGSSGCGRRRRAGVVATGEEEAAARRSLKKVAARPIPGRAILFFHMR